MENGVSEIKPREMKESRLRTQAETCMRILSGTLDAVLKKGVPADHFLSGCFRNDRRLGSRDRRLIGEMVFSVFRWFGFLRNAFGKEMEGGFPRRALSLCLLGASALEGHAQEVCRFWLEEVSLSAERFHHLFSMENELERFRVFALLAGAEYVPEIGHALPEWAHEELVHPFDLRFYRFLQSRPPMWLRAQTDDVSGLLASLAAQGLHAQRHARISSALSIPDARVNLHTIDAFRKGWMEVQDLSSQCIGLACMPNPGEIWHDACSGGGGKALQLASLMRRRGVVIATDIREQKLSELKKRAARAGFPNIRTGTWNTEVDEEKKNNLCSGVLVDAPCGSSGRWRRNPEARWTAKREQLESLSRTQLEILDRASRRVRSGGVLVYATCSMFRRENRDVVNAFLETHREFHLEPFPNPLTGERNDGTQQIMPWDGDCDASFAARMRRN